ncbi:MAG TPA: glycosyltransferase [Beijerinckiaceae bacterium]|jgi:predicted glycosyltransferase
MRVMIVVTHLLGAGHLTRAATLARAFARAGHETVLVSGGIPSALVKTAPARLVQLPPVRSNGTDFKTLLDEAGRPIAPSTLADRKALLLATLEDVKPDVLLTELFPFGRRTLSDEFLALLEAARHGRPRPLVLASVRDILALPSKPDRVEEALTRVQRLYDGVLVHGDATLVPLDLSWPVDDRLRPFLHETGYVDEGGRPPPGLRRGDEILVSAGSSPTGVTNLEVAVEAARLVPEKPWRLLVPRSIDQGTFRRLAGEAPGNVSVERTRPDFRTLLAGAAVSVSQVGYNTTVDLLVTGTPAVLIPFETGGETEQRLRAERLAARGLATVLPEAELGPDALARAVTRALERPPTGPSGFAFDGAARSVALTKRLLASKRGSPIRKAAYEWSSLDEALAQRNGDGGTIEVWWRDDDAVAAGPALERLLGLAHRLEHPLGLAVIPAGVEASLAERLASERSVAVLVHGWAHANHAPAGEKKSEFGSHRPLAAMVDEADRGLSTLRDRLGPGVLPIFVPPWNRIAPSLAAQLSTAGYRGLSTFGPVRPGTTPPGLVQVNAHLDPIDWHGSRGLSDPEGLIRALAGLVDEGQDVIGLLTHHLTHDEAVWHFCEALLERLSRSEAVRHPFVGEMFSCRAAPGLTDLDAVLEC